MADQVLIGCSGWAYKDWKGDFYPADLKDKDRLAYYQSRFPTLEINASFYRLPSEKAVKHWAESAPPGFVYAWKASRYITHNKKLKDCQDSIALVFGRMAPLGVKGPVLLLIVPLEFLSNILVRPVTLALRLFANMFAGHLLLVLFAIGGEYLIIESPSLVNVFGGVLAWVMFFAVSVLELLVMFLQAYVFTLLTAMYVGGALADEH